MRFYESNVRKFQNKYRVDTIRLQGYDYSQNGFYFVTICTKNREHYFGKIVTTKMVLAKIGQIARRELLKTEKIRKNVELDKWIIMPNHIHVIIVINNDVATVATQCIASLPPLPQLSIPLLKTNKFGPQSNNLASIIRGFKMAVQNYATINKIDFTWQRRYYDHIIRNEKSLNRIREYIRNNPKNWHKDRNNLGDLYM